MTYFTMTDYQVGQSVSGAIVQNAISNAIREAVMRVRRIECDLTVIRTFDGNVCIFNSYEMKVRTNEIEEEIFNTDFGFIFPNQAA